MSLISVLRQNLNLVPVVYWWSLSCQLLTEISLPCSRYTIPLLSPLPPSLSAPPQWSRSWNFEVLLPKDSNYHWINWPVLYNSSVGVSPPKNSPLHQYFMIFLFQFWYKNTKILDEHSTKVEKYCENVNIGCLEVIVGILQVIECTIHKFGSSTNARYSALGQNRCSTIDGIAYVRSLIPLQLIKHHHLSTNILSWLQCYFWSENL